jgi:hypothetical protein
MSNYQKAVELPVSVPMREGREFLHTTTAGVKVPLLQSLTLGGMVMFFMFAIGLAFGWLDPWKLALVMGGMTTLGWLVWALMRWSNLTRPEQANVQVRSVDHDNDPSTPKVIRVELSKVKESGHYEWNTFNLPEGVTHEMMTDLANGILNMHKPFTESEWSGPGKPFSRPKFYQLRSLMENRKLIELKNEKDARQGFRFNSDGEQFLQGFLA